MSHADFIYRDLPVVKKRVHRLGPAGFRLTSSGSGMVTSLILLWDRANGS
jgi:hypothetical protein